MIVIPSTALLGIIAMLSMFAATILRKRWMQYVALGLAGLEIAMLVFLVTVDR